MKSLLLVTLALITTHTTAYADEFVTKVENADCSVVSKSGSAAGALIGGTGGAVVGSIVGKALFGKSGGTIGGIAGGAGGAIAGENIGANKTYQCILKVRSLKGDVLYAKTLSSNQYYTGQDVKVVVDSNGNVLIQ